MIDKEDIPQDKDARHATLVSAAESAAALLKQALDPKRDTLELPMLMAALFERLEKPERSLESYLLETTIDVRTGTKLSALIPDCLAMHARLMEQGHTSREKAFDFGYADRYAFAVIDRTDALPFGFKIHEDQPDHYEVHTKGVVLLTQNIDYLVILHQRFEHWSLHLRRLSGLETKGSSRAPGLMAYLDGPQIPGEPNSCPGLLYGDIRDSGYLASVTSTFGPSADKVLRGDYATLAYVTFDLVSAVDTILGRV